MKIVIEASSMAELRALLEEMTQVPVLAPKNVNPLSVFTEPKVATEYKVEGVGGTFSTPGEKPKKEKKEKPVPEPEPTPDPKVELPTLTRDDVLAKIKVVKAGPDPDIAEKVKKWLGKAGVEKLADCSNEQYHALVKELKL
jgi:hypothetical protein